MDDIEELCERVIIIDDGNKIYDGKLQKVKNKYADWKRITVVYKKSKKPFNYKFEIIEKEEDLLVFKCPNKRLKEVMDKVLESFEIIDLKVEEPMLKEIIKKIYVDKKVK